jgi:hypothetical protein
MTLRDAYQLAVCLLASVIVGTIFIGAGLAMMFVGYAEGYEAGLRDCKEVGE